MHDKSLTRANVCSRIGGRTTPSGLHMPQREKSCKAGEKGKDGHEVTEMETPRGQLTCRGEFGRAADGEGAKFDMSVTR